MRIGRYEVANETSKTGEKYIVRGRENPHDQITKETPTTNDKETHTKANDGVGRPKGEHSKINNLSKTTCSNVTQHKKDASSIDLSGQRICTRVNTHTHFGGFRLSQPTRDDT